MLHEVGLGQLLDWVVPAILGIIAWFLRRLDESVRQLTTSMAVHTQRMDDVERRVSQLESH